MTLLEKQAIRLPLINPFVPKKADCLICLAQAGKKGRKAGFTFRTQLLKSFSKQKDLKTGCHKKMCLPRFEILKASEIAEALVRTSIIERFRFGYSHPGQF